MQVLGDMCALRFFWLILCRFWVYGVFVWLILCRFWGIGVHWVFFLADFMQVLGVLCVAVFFGLVLQVLGVFFLADFKYRRFIGKPVVYLRSQDHIDSDGFAALCGLHGCWRGVHLGRQR
jgi:hypothetical protein